MKCKTTQILLLCTFSPSCILPAIYKKPPYLLVDVRGVGYEVQAPMTSFYPLPEVGGEVVLYTHFSVSENAQQLFAFYTDEERQLFRVLIKVNGVGPKVAAHLEAAGIRTLADLLHCLPVIGAHDTTVEQKQLTSLFPHPESDPRACIPPILIGRVLTIGGSCGIGCSGDGSFPTDFRFTF